MLKGILDKVEKEDRAEQKRQRKQETAEEKQRRVMASKLQAVLFKQKESLKRDMLKKRALLEKTLHSDIQVTNWLSMTKPDILSNTVDKNGNLMLNFPL